MGWRRVFPLCWQSKAAVFLGCEDALQEEVLFHSSQELRGFTISPAGAQAPKGSFAHCSQKPSGMQLLGLPSLPHDLLLHVWEKAAFSLAGIGL